MVEKHTVLDWEKPKPKPFKVKFSLTEMDRRRRELAEYVESVKVLPVVAVDTARLAELLLSVAESYQSAVTFMLAKVAEATQRDVNAVAGISANLARISKFLDNLQANVMLEREVLTKLKEKLDKI